MRSLNIVSFWKLVHHNENELTGTSMLFTMIVSRFEKSHCLLKLSIPLPWQQNLIKKLATGATSKLMIQTREPFPHTISSILLAYYRHSISNMVYTPQIFHFPESQELFCNGVYKLWKMVGLNYNIKTCQ